MSSEWPKVKLAEYCEKIGSGATPRGGSKVYLESGEIALVRSQNVYNHGFEYDGLVYIEEDTAEKLSNVELEENDVLINITGDSVARVCMVPDDVLPARVNQHVSILRPKNNFLDPRYLRYSLVNYENQYKLLAIASAGGTRKAITKGHLEDFEISLPDLDYQKKVSEILSTFDQKIHLNRQTNETLEAMAQAIFKSWFVDFDPVRAKIEARSVGRAPNRAAMAAIAGVSLEMDWDEIETTLQRKLDRMTEPQRAQLRQTAELFPDELVESEIGVVPKGWDIKPLDEIADYLNGRAMQKYPPENGKPTLPVLKIAQLRKGDTESADIATADIPEKFKVRDGDMIFSWSGSLLIRLWAGGDTALNQHLFKVTSEEYAQWFYYHWTKYHLDNFIRIAESKAVTMGHIKRSHLKEAKCAIPSRDLLEFGKQQIEPLLAQSLQSKIESRNLAELRDTLLPKLISGEIGV